MSTRIVVGNLAEDAVVTMTPPADPNLPVEFMSDGPGQLGPRFGALDANPEVLVDLALPLSFGNGFEDGVTPGAVLATDSPSLSIDFPTPWSLVSNTPADGTYLGAIQEADMGFTFTDDYDDNGWTLGLGSNNNGGTAKLTQAVVPGESYIIKGAVVNATGASNAGAIRLRDTLRNLYLGTDGEFHSGAQDLVLDATDDRDWLPIAAGAGVAFDVPSRDILGVAELTLELQLVNQDAGFAYYDGLQLIRAAEVDFLGVFGNHNVNAALVPTWEISDDGVSWTPVATLTPTKHQFFKLLDAPVSARFHRLQFVGTPTLKTWFGDLVLGLAQALEREPQEPLQIDYIEAGQVRLESPGGSQGISNRGPYPLRRVSMRFRFATAAEEAAVRAILVDQVRGGAVSVVVLPAADFGELAIYGDLEAGLQMSHSMLSARQPDPTRREYYSDGSFIVREGAGFEMML